jgi:hypothetical protein
MITEKMPLKKENEPSCLGAVIRSFSSQILIKNVKTITKHKRRSLRLSI